MNLTGITDREQVYTKHFYDSVSLAFYTDMTKVNKLADIGSEQDSQEFLLRFVFHIFSLQLLTR